jgi:cytoskeletal protein CcmA (bactofilin family)
MAEEDKDTSTPDKDAPKEENTVELQEEPADALSRTPDDLEQERAERAAADTDLSGLDDELPEKKISPFKRFLRKVNVYFLIFILVLVVAGAIALISFLNSQKAPETPDIESQSLTTEALKDLANTDASVGNTAQTLTIQGSAVINGQTLARGNLNVAGNFQTGGTVTTPGLTVSGATNLGDTQINSLQIASNTAIQGTTTLRDLNVSGATSFSGAVTASQITVSRLILSGNATLEVPNHVSFTGSTPRRTTNGSVLGNGGSANISGSDTAGTININSGNNPTAGCFVTVQFNQAFTRQPHVNVTPVGSSAGQLQFYVERSTSSFSVCSTNAASSNKTFAFDYFITY